MWARRPTVRECALGLMILCAASRSYTQDVQKVPAMIAQVAKESRVPVGLFYAIVLAESRSPTQQGPKTWPWTINRKGIPHYFQTREQAYHYATKLVEQGTNNFDIGIAQMNWKWHQGTFDRDLWLALDPYTNLRAGAEHFRHQYDRPACGDWARAVGCYHRPARGKNDRRIAKKYTERVLKIWREF